MISLQGADPGRSLLADTRVPFIAEVSDAVEPFLARCARLSDNHTLPFHSTVWLRAWYATFGSSEGRHPLLLAVRHRHSGADAVLLPLVAWRRAGLKVVAFADAGVVDYVAPLLAPQWFGDLSPQAAAPALWRAIRGALRGHDVFQVHKLLEHLLEEAGGAPNPLAAVLRPQPCEMFGNQFSVVGDWDAWRHSLDKRTRKEIERCWRVFQRSPLARFEHATEPARALALFEVLERQQGARMQALQADYALDSPVSKAFHRLLIKDGVASGQVVVTALLDGDEVVSALFGLANGQRYMGLRQSLGGEAWKHCSPARLLDEQTSRHWHQQGRRYFDFGIGDYHHKQTLQMTAIALLDARVALSWRGLPRVWGWRLRQWLKRQAWLLPLRQGLARHAGRQAAR